MGQDGTSALREQLSKYIDAKAQAILATQKDEEFSNTIRYIYGAHLLRVGAKDPTVGKLFLAIWEYFQEEIENGIKIVLDTRPLIYRDRVELLELKIRTWKIGRDFFYEEKVDELNLEYGVELREANGYETVKALFSRKIESLERDLDLHRSKQTAETELLVPPVDVTPQESTSNSILALAKEVRRVMDFNDFSKKQVAGFIGRDRKTLDRFFAGSATSATVAQLKAFTAKYGENQVPSP
jgi:hypothetical protein